MGQFLPLVIEHCH